jgi:protein-disulfide isomerase
MLKGQSSHFQLAAFLITLLVALVACNPVATNEQDPFEQNLLESTPAVTEAESTSVSANTGAGDSNTSTDNTSGNSLSVEPGSEEVDANGVTVGFTTDGYAFRGDPNAPVLLEEYSDYQCPYCGRFYEQTLPALDENQIANGEVVLVFYDFPLSSIHPQAPAAHEAAHCAGAEGAAAYWAMHDTLFETSNQWSGQANTDQIFTSFAQQLELDQEQFSNCLAEDRYDERIQASLEAGSVRGVNSTPSFFINGQSLVGAQPLARFNQAIATVAGGGQLDGQTANEPSGPTIVPTPASIDNDFAAAFGDPDAPVTIVEYTDYECPYCARHSTQTAPRLFEEYVESGDVYYVVKDFPIDQIHPRARGAAVAARCAGEQDAYKEMHDMLFAQQSQWAGREDSLQQFEAFAGELGLDSNEFAQCLDSGKYDEAIEANFREGQLLGVSGTPTFFIEGFPIRGAQQFELFAYAIDLAQQGELANAYAQPAQPTPAPQEAVDVPLGDGPAIGDPDAPVVIVEYTDFQCPYCARHFQQTLPQIKENFIDTGMVYYVFKDFPLTNIHPQAMVAAEAGRCAHDQGAYMEMHDILFQRQSQWGNNQAAEIFTGYAEELGLDVDTFAECMSSGKHEAGIMADLEEGAGFGVRGTPGFFINGNFVSGAQPYGLFEEAILQLAAEAEE